LNYTRAPLDFREVGEDPLLSGCLSIWKALLHGKLGFAALNPTYDLGFPPPGACIDFASAPS